MDRYALFDEGALDAAEQLALGAAAPAIAGPDAAAPVGGGMPPGAAPEVRLRC